MSQINVDTIKKADGTGNLSVPAETGTVVTTASPSLGRRNLIINGAMQVAQRGTSSTSGGYSTVDRFTVLKNNMDELEVTASQSTTAPSDQGFPKAYKLDVTTAESALASDEQYSIEYRMEGQDLQALQYGQTNARTSVLTFYVRSSQTGQYALAVFQEDGGNDLFVANYTIDTADTFEKKTITIDGNTAAAIANDNTEGLKLKWWLMAGSDFTSDNSAVGNWVTYTSARYAHGHTVSWGLSASDDFYITGVQLEVGSVATPFEHRSYGEELAACQRYYTKVTVDSANDSFCVGLCDAAGNATGDVFFPTTMRVAPTALEQTGTASDYEIRKAGSTITCNVVPDYIRASQFQSTVSFNALGLTAGQAALLRAATTSAYLAWSAEL